MKKIIVMVPFIFLPIGIGMDLWVNLTGKYLIGVTQSYMECLFTGTITISVLCFSFISLLSSLLERVYLGYTLKDMLGFSNLPINTKLYIFVSIGSLVVGFVLLVLNYRISLANSMSGLLLLLVFFEAIVLYRIYKMITNDKYVTDILNDYFSSKVDNGKIEFEEFCRHINRIMNGLENCINTRNSDTKEKICELAIKLGQQIKKRKGENEYYLFYNYFNDKIKSNIYEFTMSFGFNEMLNFVVNIYKEISDFEYERGDIYIIPLEKMRFWDEQMLLEKNCFEQIKDICLLEIYKNKNVSNDEIERVFYVYFCSIIKNSISSKETIKRIVEEYIAEMMKFHWISNEKKDSPDLDVLLLILKNFVLKNEDKEERDFILGLIVKYAFQNNLSRYKEEYFEFIALLFQSFYAYVFCEQETLSRNYREELQQTFKLDFSTNEAGIINTAVLLRKNILNILIALARRIAKEQKKSSVNLENVSTNLDVKTLIWTRSFDVDFLFMLYLIYNDEIGMYRIYEDLFDGAKLSDEDKMFALKQFQDKFDIETGLMNKFFVEQCIELGSIVGHCIIPEEREQQEIFKQISEEYSNIRIEKTINKKGTKEIENEKVTISEISTIVNDRMKNRGVFGWEEGFDSENCMEFFIPESIGKEEFITKNSMAETIQEGIIEAICIYIRENCSKLELTFDLEGIDTLRKFIDETDFDARNYIFTNDLALAKFYSENLFIQLKEEEKKVEFTNTPQIHEYIYFMKNKFKFTANIIQIQKSKLSDEECARFLERSKSYNGLYNVDGALMAKEQAMEFAKEVYRKEKYSFNLIVGFDKNDVTYIDFKL